MAASHSSGAMLVRAMFVCQSHLRTPDAFPLVARGNSPRRFDRLTSGYGIACRQQAARGPRTCPTNPK